MPPGSRDRSGDSAEYGSGAGAASNAGPAAPAACSQSSLDADPPRVAESTRSSGPALHAGLVGANDPRREGMLYRIDREALSEFLTRQLDIVEGTRPSVALDELAPADPVDRDETRAAWLGAGLATHVGLAIFEEPEQFVTLGDGIGGAA